MNTVGKGIFVRNAKEKEFVSITYKSIDVKSVMVESSALTIDKSIIVNPVKLRKKQKKTNHTLLFQSYRDWKIHQVEPSCQQQQ